jgi:hypothetical protein
MFDEKFLGSLWKGCWRSSREYSFGSRYPTFTARISEKNSPFIFLLFCPPFPMIVCPNTFVEEGTGTRRIVSFVLTRWISVSNRFIARARDFSSPLGWKPSSSSIYYMTRIPKSSSLKWAVPWQPFSFMEYVRTFLHAFIMGGYSFAMISSLNNHHQQGTSC